MDQVWRNSVTSPPSNCSCSITPSCSSFAKRRARFLEHSDSRFGWNLTEFNTKKSSCYIMFMAVFLFRAAVPPPPICSKLIYFSSLSLFLSLPLRLACSHLIHQCVALTVFFLLCLRTFCRRSPGSKAGPVEVQLSGEPPDGGFRGQAEPQPGPSPLPPSTTARGPRKRMQPELPHRYRQVLRRTFWRW